jgi:hypothetical protein
MHICKKRSDRSKTRSDALLRDVRAVRKRGRRGAAKVFRIHFRIMAIYCSKVRQTDVKRHHLHFNWTQSTLNRFNTRSNHLGNDGGKVLRNENYANYTPSPLPYFSKLSHQQHDFRREVMGHKMYVLIFLKRLCETFLTLKSNKHYITINVHSSSYTVLVIIVRF